MRDGHVVMSCFLNLSFASMRSVLLLNVSLVSKKKNAFGSNEIYSPITIISSFKKD